MKKFLNNLRSLYRHTFLVSSIIILFFTGSVGAFLQFQAAPISNAGGVELYASSATERAYLTILGRRADKGGKDFWYKKMLNRPDASWLAGELMKSSEYQRSDLWAANNTKFTDTLYLRAYGRSASSNERSLWVGSLENQKTSRANLAGFVIENGFTFKLTPPNANAQYEQCRAFSRVGIYNNVRPLCTKGSVGTTKNIALKRDQSNRPMPVTGSNIYVNEVWYKNISDLRSAALKAGFNLQAHREPGKAFAAMLSPGSWRSWDEQNWLYTHGYPANKPGTSMHEWGLAVDFSCNGASIVKNQACWNWVRKNGGAYNVHNYKDISSIKQKEAWHFSANSL